MRVVDCCVRFPSPAAATVFCPFLPTHFRLIVAFISLFLTPDTPARIPIDCCVVCVSCCVPSWPLAFRPEVINQPEPSSVHLSLDSAVIATTMASESLPPTPPPVAVTFVMVLVGFGGG